ncbi:MAG: hypothetical protein ACRDVE_02280, partial [Actinocrinis sp.]
MTDIVAPDAPAPGDRHAFTRSLERVPIGRRGEPGRGAGRPFGPVFVSAPAHSGVFSAPFGAHRPFVRPLNRLLRPEGVNSGAMTILDQILAEGYATVRL